MSHDPAYPIHVPTVSYSYMCRFYNCAATAAAFLKRAERPQAPTAQTWASNRRQKARSDLEVER